MKASYDWLREFCPTPISAVEMADLLTARCATVEEVAPVRADLAPIIVARVVQASRHPDSDHLWVTRVDAGNGELLDVVCGAPNVREGQLYPFARVGVTLPGGLKLERRKIRGAISNGMLCSARELGLGDEQEGILALETDAPPGTPLLQAVPVGDVRLEVDVSPARPDLLSHLGIAREIAALTGVALTRPAVPGVESEGGRSPTAGEREAAAGRFLIRVDEADACPRYMAALIRGVRIGESPAWLRTRLDAVGARSINNVVDATNYMLHGFGQPMHAFDAAKLGGEAIVVRYARPGERLVTLDGAERALATHTLVIADAKRAQALAGIMGGRESEVSAGTTDVLLEVAIFEPKGIRRSRRALGMSTDASYRYERGIDPEGAAEALQFAVQLITSMAGGALDGVADVRAPVASPAEITLRPARVSRLVGVEIPAAESSAHLRSVGFAVRYEGEVLRVAAPSWRMDVAREVDLIEEVARLHGYDALPSELRAYRPGTVPDSPFVAVSRRIRDTLVAAGLLETRPMPFVAGSDETHVRVRNPLAENEAFLRRSILETLARRVEFNLAHREGNLRLFEIGNTFVPSGAALPHERAAVGAVILGDRRPPHFTEPKPPQFDEWDAKGIVETLAERALSDRTIALEPANDDERTPAGRVLWRVMVNGTRLGEVVRLELDAPVWASPAFGIEITLEAVESAPVAPRGQADYSVGERARTRHAPPARTFRPLPATPAVDLDLALVVPNETAAATVEDVIRRSAGELLERLVTFDEFRGPGLPDGTRSIAMRLTFRDPVRTLRDKEVEGRRQKILRTLEGELGVRQRTS